MTLYKFYYKEGRIEVRANSYEDALDVAVQRASCRQWVPIHQKKER